MTLSPIIAVRAAVLSTAALTLTACLSGEPSESELSDLYSKAVGRGAGFLGVRVSVTAFTKTGCSAAPGANVYRCSADVAFSDGSAGRPVLTVAKAGDRWTIQDIQSNPL